MPSASTEPSCRTVTLTPSARTKTVYEGPPPLAKTFITRSFDHKYAPDVDDFFLHTVVINQGDTVKWINTGFHTVDIPTHGAGDLPFLVPGATVTGDKDWIPYGINFLDEARGWVGGSTGGYGTSDGGKQRGQNDHNRESHSVSPDFAVT